MLQFNQVSFGFEDELLLEHLNVTVHAGQKVGLVGRNGVGKSTLFSMILRNLEPDDGTVEYPRNWRLAWLNQHISPSARSALDFVIDGNKELRKTEQRLEQAQINSDNDAIAELLDRYEQLQGYQAHSFASRVLTGLGFSQEEFSKPHHAFSGGWRIRLNLAQALMTPCDILLLDEPTNHLDFEAIVWLQSWLKKFSGTLLTISHDREFLDRTVERVIHIEHLRAEEYRGNYSSFEEQRAARLELEEKLWIQQERERERVETFIRRFRAKATKARQVQSRIKRLERMQATAPARMNNPYKLVVNSPSRYDDPMVTFDHINLGYDDRDVLSDITLRIYPGNRIGILGLNGAGKSTLLKAIAGELQPRSGELNVGSHTTIGYFAQHQLELLDPTISPMEALLNVASIQEKQARTYLGGWGFHGEDVYRTIDTFSGGEKARLVLALITRHAKSILLLDEPTNHLDMDMRAALSQALQEYEGAVLLVAHDRYLLDSCVDEFWLVVNGKVSPYEGDLDDYESHVIEALEPPQQTEKRTSQKELRRQRAAERQASAAMQRKLKEIEAALESLRQDMNEIERNLADREHLSSLDGAELEKALRKHAKVKDAIATKEHEWLEIAETVTD